MRIRSATGYLVLGRTVAIGDSTFCQLIDRRGPGLFVPQQEQQQNAEPNVRREQMHNVGGELQISPRLRWAPRLDYVCSRLNADYSIGRDYDRTQGQS